MDLNFDLNLSNLGTSPDFYDVIIIGGGPAGTSAAIYTARANLRTLVLDKGLKGQVVNGLWTAIRITVGANLIHQ